MPSFLEWLKDAFLLSVSAITADSSHWKQIKLKQQQMLFGTTYETVKYGRLQSMALNLCTFHALVMFAKWCHMRHNIMPYLCPHYSEDGDSLFLPKKVRPEYQQMWYHTQWNWQFTYLHGGSRHCAYVRCLWRDLILTYQCQYVFIPISLGSSLMPFLHWRNLLFHCAGKDCNANKH